MNEDIVLISQNSGVNASLLIYYEKKV